MALPALLALPLVKELLAAAAITGGFEIVGAQRRKRERQAEASARALELFQREIALGQARRDFDYSRELAGVGSIADALDTATPTSPLETLPQILEMRRLLAENRNLLADTARPRPPSIIETLAAQALGR